MKRCYVPAILLLSISVSLSAESALRLSAGYGRSGYYDMVYSPDLYAGDGIDARFGLSFDTGLLHHTVDLGFFYSPIHPLGTRIPADFTVLRYGVEAPLDILTGYYRADGFGFMLSYSPAFPLTPEGAIFSLFLGPEISAHFALPGLETYCGDYSLGTSVMGELRISGSQIVSFRLSVPIVSLVNRPAYTLFDNQIIINFENNLIAEFFHVDRVVFPFSGSFYSVDFCLGYDFLFSEIFSIGLEYRGYQSYCGFPDAMVRLDHCLRICASMRF